MVPTTTTAGSGSKENESTSTTADDTTAKKTAGNDRGLTITDQSSLIILYIIQATEGRPTDRRPDRPTTGTDRPQAHRSSCHIDVGGMGLGGGRGGEEGRWGSIWR